MCTISNNIIITKTHDIIPLYGALCLKLYTSYEYLCGCLCVDKLFDLSSGVSVFNIVDEEESGSIMKQYEIII